MKRKVVVAMSLSYWVDDKWWGSDPPLSDEEIIKEVEANDWEVLENAEEISIIQVEITERKE